MSAKEQLYTLARRVSEFKEIAVDTESPVWLIRLHEIEQAVNGCIKAIEDDEEREGRKYNLAQLNEYVRERNSWDNARFNGG